MITVLLYTALAFSIFEVMAILSQATKPREDVTPGVAAFAGAVLLVYAIPVTWLLVTGEGLAVTVAAAFLAFSGVLGAANLARQVHGVRGPRTPATTFVSTLVSVADVAALVVILAELT